MFKQFQDWLSEGTLQPVKLETPEQHVARFNTRARELAAEMGARYLLHPANKVRRLDGKVYGKPAPQNVRAMRKRVRDEQAA